MVKTICLLFGSFLILQAHGTSVRRAGCNGDPNAESGCDTCNTNCDNYDIKPKICSKRPCRPGECKCKDGFVKNSKGLCIPYEECPPCGQNEVYIPCSGHCKESCKNKNPICTLICRPRCICRPDYVRDIKTNKCIIKKNQCPGCNGDPNAESGCDTCNTNCENYDIKPKICSKRPCRLGECKCKDGFVKNSKGLCIPYEECLRCPDNEEYKCVVPCPPKRCSTRFALIKCRGDQVCVNKCECKAGYLRNNKGRCVKRNQCEKPKCGKNEVFACHITCPPKTCKSMVARIICPKPNPCREQCDCKDNYLRNNDGICIPSKQCFPSLSEPNKDDASPPNKTDETTGPDTGDDPPPADDDSDDGYD